MRIAKDGKPFDIDVIGENYKEDEIEIIQMIRPHGKRRRVLATVGKEIVELAKDMIIIAELLPNDQLAIWVRKQKEKEDKEIMEIADNGPGKDSPTECLKRLIFKKLNKGVNKNVYFKGPCPFLLCLKSGPHSHSICPKCGAIRHGNAYCDDCKKYWEDQKEKKGN